MYWSIHKILMPSIILQVLALRLMYMTTTLSQNFPLFPTHSLHPPSAETLPPRMTSTSTIWRGGSKSWRRKPNCYIPSLYTHTHTRVHNTTHTQMHTHTGPCHHQHSSQQEMEMFKALSQIWIVVLPFPRWSNLIDNKHTCILTSCL